MKTFCKIIGLLTLYLIILGPISGCTTQTTNVISTNKFIQTDYDYDCLAGDKTFTQIIICYQKQDAAEKTQNHITNDLINQ